MLHQLYYRYIKNVQYRKVQYCNRYSSVLTIYECLINGLANIFNHNLVEMYQQDAMTSKKMATYQRQLVFDLIFLLENIVLLIFGCMADVHPLNDFNTLKWFIPVNFAMHFCGLGMKIIYYKFFHLWKDKYELTMGRRFFLCLSDW